MDIFFYNHPNSNSNYSLENIHLIPQCEKHDKIRFVHKKLFLLYWNLISQQI